MAHLMLLHMGTETKLINKVDDFTKVITTLYFVFQFAEYFPDFIFQRIGRFRIGPEFF